MTPAAPPRRVGLRAPVEVRLERRLGVPRWLGPATTVGAIVVALLLSALIIAIAGGDPVRTYLHILSAAFGAPA